MKIKFKKEVGLGAFSVLIIIASIYGYRFLAGENLLGPSKTYYTYVDNAKGIIRSSPVFLKGFQVGTVTDLKFVTRDDGSFKVGIQMRIDEPVDIPSDAVAQIMETGFVGGKAIRIMFDAKSKALPLKSGDEMKGEAISILEAMIGAPEEITPYTDELRQALTAVYDSITEDARHPKGPGLGKTFHDLDIILAEMKITAHNLNRLIRATDQNLPIILSNLADVTTALKQSNDKITDILANTASFTDKLNNSGIDSTIHYTNEVAKSLNTTLHSTDAALKNLNKLLTQTNEGNGSLTKLISDPKLYDNLNETSRQLHLLLQDLRLNPKRYVNVSIFGKKQKKYELPKDDPANRQ